MQSLSPLQTPTFNLLSLGERGVGKTVFLVASYAELNKASDKNQDAVTAQPPKLWFESSEPAERELMAKILHYIIQTGHYPPPTLKITDFHFSFKQRHRFGVKTLCHFRWWDIPGEYCNFENSHYQTLVLNSHSCCVFINAERLVNDPSYRSYLKTLTQQVVSLARLVEQGELSYRFALIFTQCDHLGPGTTGSLQIEERIQDLVTKLDAVSASYQRFYSGIAITQQEEQWNLDANGASTVFLWLVAELYKKYSPVDSATVETGLQQKTDAARSLRFPLPRFALLLTGAISLVLITAGGLFFWRSFQPQNRLTTSDPSGVTNNRAKYEALIEKEPDNLEAHVELANTYLEAGELDKAIPILQKIIALNPDNQEWQFNLAKLYELSDQSDKAEAIYDQILATNSQDFKALLGKALIRQAKGDTETAQKLFQTAASVAPSPELKQEIQQLAEQSAPGSPPP